LPFTTHRAVICSLVHWTLSTSGYVSATYLALHHFEISQTVCSNITTMETKTKNIHAMMLLQYYQYSIYPNNRLLTIYISNIDENCSVLNILKHVVSVWRITKYIYNNSTYGSSCLAVYCSQTVLCIFLVLDSVHWTTLTNKSQHRQHTL